MEEREDNRNDDADSPTQQSSGESESLGDECVDNENDLTFENDDGDRVDDNSLDGNAPYAAAHEQTGGDENNEGGHGEESLRDQDRFVPIANVGRIMKQMISPAGKVSKEAKECVQECVSEFISFITMEASERCQQEKRKTINGEDILWAMQTLGFDNYLEPMKAYLAKYREAFRGDHRNLPAAQPSFLGGGPSVPPAVMFPNEMDIEPTQIITISAASPSAGIAANFTGNSNSSSQAYSVQSTLGQSGGGRKNR